MIKINTPKKKVLEVISFSSDQKYQIDVAARSCNCAAPDHCRHLDLIGINKTGTLKASKWPPFSMGMSALVKSIRLRRLDDAIYWLMYLFNSQSKEDRMFRLARRLLVSSGEDGVSIPVMERVARNAPHLWSKEGASLMEFAAEVHRICAVPNWWDASTNGHKYINDYVVAYNRGLYRTDFGLHIEEKESLLSKHVKDQDTASALYMYEALMAEESYPKERFCDLLLALAALTGNKDAEALATIHKTNKRAMAWDSNMLGQALWCLCGNEFNHTHTIEKVMASDVRASLDRAREAWKTPEPIPEWCCDGIHCGGYDRRFAGTVTDMYAMCSAFNQYGRLDPQDQWLTSFYSLEGIKHSWK